MPRQRGALLTILYFLTLLAIIEEIGTSTTSFTVRDIRRRDLGDVTQTIKSRVEETPLRCICDVDQIMNDETVSPLIR